MIIYFETAPEFRIDTVFGEPYVGILQRDMLDDSLYVTRYRGSIPICNESDPYVIEQQSWYIQIDQPTVFEVHISDDGVVYYYCDLDAVRQVDRDEAVQLCHEQLDCEDQSKIWLQNSYVYIDEDDDTGPDGVCLPLMLDTPEGLIEMQPGEVKLWSLELIENSPKIKDIIKKGWLKVLSNAEVRLLGNTEYVDELAGNASMICFDPDVDGGITKINLK